MMEAIKELFGQITAKSKIVVIEVPPLMQKGEYEDVIAIRHPLKCFTRFTNVPYVMGDLVDEGAGFGWGYGGTGPMNFAFNILLHFTNHDEAVARAYHIEFCEEFLKDMPEKGGCIPKDLIFAFVERMRIAKPDELEWVQNDMDLTAKLQEAEISAQNRHSELAKVTKPTAPDCGAGGT